MTLYGAADVDLGVYRINGSRIGVIKRKNVAKGEHYFDVGAKVGPGLYLIYGSIGETQVVLRGLVK
jgi:hypothetical protein